MTNLKVLNLANNKIDKVTQYTFKDLTSLESLFLNDNKLVKLPPLLLSPLTNLKEFYAEFNQIEELGDNFFGNNKKIEKIFLQNNNLIRLNERFTSLKNLQIVDLRDNDEVCRICDVITDDKSKAIYERCERNKFDGEARLSREYVECVERAAKGKEDVKGRLEICFTAKAMSFETFGKNFIACTSGKESDRCINEKNVAQAMAQKGFKDCIGNKRTKNPDINDLLQDCVNTRNANDAKGQIAYQSCTLCKKMDDKNFRTKCSLKFVEYYEHNINQFQADVTNAFKVNRMN